MPAAADDPLAIRLLYSPHRPEPPQHAYLWLNDLEALYGGAAGGGKSDALLMAALQYVDVPGYAALLLRRTYQDLALPGALMDRANAWLAPTDARWSGDTFRWTFPSGATLSFGYLQTSRDRYRYASAEFQFIGFDELTQFPEADYRFLFSRLRRPSLVDADGRPLDLTAEEREVIRGLSSVPLRMRAASNPGGLGHAWVKRRYVDRLPDPDDDEDTLARARRRLFVPAKLADNPHVDQDTYRAALSALTRVERERLLNGDWNADLGDRYYPPDGIDAAINLGADLEALAARGDAPPPAGGLLAVGIDHGDRTHYLIGWPLERGGLWIVRGEELRGYEPGAAAKRFAAELGTVPAWEGAPRITEPLELVDELRYDAAGLSSQRTWNSTLRTRRPRLKVRKIGFGAKAGGETGLSYKRESGLYLRYLLERAAAGHDTQVLAISPGLARFIAQMRNLVRDPKDEELPLKPPADAADDEQDHGPDALIALAAPVAVRHRRRE